MCAHDVAVAEGPGPPHRLRRLGAGRVRRGHLVSELHGGLPPLQRVGDAAALEVAAGLEAEHAVAAALVVLEGEDLAGEVLEGW